MHNYIIVANNKNIKNNFITNLSNPIIITLNHAAILCENKIDNNIIYHFSRRSFNKKIPYSGLKNIEQIKSKLEKLFLYPHPESIGNKKQKQKVINYINHNTSINISNISHMSGFGKHQYTKEARYFLRNTGNNISNMSMGLISYLYIKQIKDKRDGVYIYGFTHQMNKNFHNPVGEKNFFNKEIEKGLCQRLELLQK